MLGMLAISLFLLAMEEYYGAISDTNNIRCDNKGALYTFEKKSNRVSSSKSNADIQQVLRTISSRMKSNYVQHHIRAYQDNIKTWINLTNKEQINSHCDSMAKSDIKAHLNKHAEFMVEMPDTEPTDCLLLEGTRVLIDGSKQTMDVSKSRQKSYTQTRA